MFTSARLRLTAWYLGIIMLLSILFSTAIYSLITHQIEGFIHMQNERIQHFQFTPPPDDTDHPKPPIVSTKELQNQEKELLYTLIFINLGIFMLAGGGGYFLAGRTLRPIKIMMDEQSRFVSDASHELKTPLAALRSEIEVYILGKNHTVAQSNAILQSSLEEVITLQSLSEHLMQLTKYESTFKTITTKLSLLDILEKALKKTIPLAREKHMKIINTVGEEIIEGNEPGLVELFVILIDNAIKYSPHESTITISSRQKDRTVYVAVKDHGMGITAKDLTKIFDRFYRVDLSRTKQMVPGHGLGLSIAKKIVDTHKGIISATSIPGQGTTFTVQLPAAA